MPNEDFSIMIICVLIFILIIFAIPVGLTKSVGQSKPKLQDEKRPVTKNSDDSNGLKVKVGPRFSNGPRWVYDGDGGVQFRIGPRFESGMGFEF